MGGRLTAIVKSRCRKIRVYTFQMIPKFDWHLGGSAAEMLIKFQSDAIIITSNLAASRLHEILRWDVRPLSEWRPSTRRKRFHGMISQNFLHRKRMIPISLNVAPMRSTTSLDQVMTWHRTGNKSPSPIPHLRQQTVIWKHDLSEM